MKRREFLVRIGQVLIGDYVDFSRKPAKALKSMQPIQFVSWGGIGSPDRVKGAASLGIDTHRLPLSPWSNEQGEYDFHAADIYLPLLKRVGLRAIVSIFSHGVPDWFWQRYPDTKPRNAQGEYGTWAGSIWSPQVHAEVLKGIKEIFAYLSRRGLLDLVDGVEVGVGMEGQLSYLWGSFWAFDPYALMAYHYFLRGRFSSIHHLNTAWGTHYAEFGDIFPPSHYQQTVACHTFLDFYRQSILETAEEWSEAVATRVQPKIWVWLSHFIAPDQRPYAARYPEYYLSHLRQLGRADVAIVSVVPGWQTRPEVENLRKLGVQTIGEWDITPTPQRQLQQAQLAWDLGCNGLFVGVLENLMDDQGRLNEVGSITKRIIKQWKNGKRPA
ncbi:beta-galactosidase [Chthonomonas calidirosea]|nr:beta-galactosidase [Chthonomonas calidirosea]